MDCFQLYSQLPAQYHDACVNERERAEAQTRVDSKSSGHSTAFPVGQEGGIPHQNRGKVSIERKDSKEGMSCGEKLRDLGRK